MASDLTDEQIVEVAIGKDPNAFGEIITRWERRIYALCYGMLNREDEAKDAVQETFISAYKNLSRFRGDSKVSTWLHRIAVNQCITQQRKLKTRSEDFIDESESKDQRVFEAPERVSPSRLAEQDERKIAVRNALNGLPDDLRQIVVMKEFEEMTFQEIADTLEMPLSTVKSRLYSALVRLRKKLERTQIEVV
ncbi:MAG: RNA polymerase sigma factor [Pyrinomonadaceae bacterium]